MIGSLRSRSRESARGVTLVELVACTAIVLVLASLALPVANNAIKRKKEMELRRNLREMREAIDLFQSHVGTLEMAGPYPGIRSKYLNTVNRAGYPEELQEHLVEGVDIGGLAEIKIKYLRRLPRDPITGEREWATRSSKDAPGALFTDGINIFDVHSTSEKIGLNGVPYNEW